MGEVLSLEDRIIRRDAGDIFKKNSNLEFLMPVSVIYALNFIGAYNGTDEDETYTIALRISSEAIEKIHANNSLRDLVDMFKVKWNRYTENSESLESICTIENPYIYNLLLNELNISQQEIFQFLYDYYIQSFLDFYNNEPQKYYIVFPDKAFSRRCAMQRGDSKLLNALKDFKHIYGFTENGIIASVIGE